MNTTPSAENDGDGCCPSAAFQINVEANESSLRSWLELRLEQLAARAGVSGDVNVVIVDDARMSQLHQQYLGCDQTTDVLTFDLRPIPESPWRRGESLEGDIVVCLDEASRQAAARGHEMRLEILLYAVHGVLHLMGMDDTTPAAADMMHRMEDEWLTSIGLGPVFNRQLRDRSRPCTGLDADKIGVCHPR